MKAPTYLHLNSYDIYYFRIAVPLRFRQYIKRTELKKSLQTRSYSVAVRRAQILAGQVYELFEQVSMMIDDDWAKLNSNWTAGLLKVDLGNGRSVEARDVSVDPTNKEDVEAFKSTIKEAIIEVAEQTSNGSAKQVTTEEPETKLFSEIIEPYIASRKGKKKDFRKETAKEYRKASERFIEILDDRMLNTYTFDDADELQQMLYRIPRNWKKNPVYRGMDLQTVTAIELPVGDRPSDRTVNKLLTVISGIFSYAQKRGWTKEKLNPFAEKQVILEYADDEAWSPFSNLDLGKFFDPDNLLHDKRFPSRFFVSILALYTGARQNEICQLKKQDIVEYGGFPCISFTNEGEGQQLKGRSSRRVTPLHPEIIRLGFLEYCNTRKDSEMLFPELTQDSEGKWSRKYRRWCNDTYLTRIGVKQQKKSFRSFRRTFTTTLRTAEVEETYAAELLGHSTGKGSFMSWNTYASRGEMPPLIKALEELPSSWTERLAPWPWGKKLLTQHK